MKQVAGGNSAGSLPRRAQGAGLTARVSQSVGAGAAHRRRGAGRVAAAFKTVASMLPTLQIGDYLLVNKLPTGCACPARALVAARELAAAALIVFSDCATAPCGTSNGHRRGGRGGRDPRQAGSSMASRAMSRRHISAAVARAI
jgi:hypothetical protein